MTPLGLFSGRMRCSLGMVAFLVLIPVPLPQPSALAGAGPVGASDAPGGPLLAASMPGGLTWWGLVGGGLAIALVTAWLVRRHERGRFDIDDCIDMAYTAVESENFGRALRWIQRARALSPRSARLLQDEAFILANLGEWAEALQRLQKAHELSKDGEAAYDAARLVGKLGLPNETLLFWLHLAVSRSPDLIAEAEEDFPAISDLPPWRELVRRHRGRR